MAMPTCPRGCLGLKRIEGMSGYRWEVMLMSPIMTPGDLGIKVIDCTEGALVVMAAYGVSPNPNRVKLFVLKPRKPNSSESRKAV